MIPSQVFDQIAEQCTEALALALADPSDGAIMHFRWCNKAFTKLTGFTLTELIGQRASLIAGPNLYQGDHLLIIEKLMNWEKFSIDTVNNRKNGQKIRQRMSWTPISCNDIEDRWWLCSLVELVDDSTASLPPYSEDGLPDKDSDTLNIKAQCEQRIGHLERENRRLVELAKDVARESNQDSLTGLSNRRHFELELKSWIDELRTANVEFAVLYVDLDRFKFVNDTLGHEAGDRLLVSVAEMLNDLTQDTDLVARLGGDEFVILKKLGASALHISELADRICRCMQAPFAFEGNSTSCSASIGVAIAEVGMPCPEDVVTNADTALYHAKSLGKGRWSFFTQEMHAKSLQTKKLSTELLAACENEEFVPFYQPIVCSKTGRLVSAEVLVRWSHPSLGIQAPAAFLDTAAKIGILKDIDKMVFRQIADAIEYFDDCNDANGEVLPKLAINVSADRLGDPSFIHDVKSSAIDPDRLTVEILESVYLERVGDVVHWTIDELKELGVTFAIDDFGTGHASVLGLLKVRPTVVKIDRQFIQPIVDDAHASELVSSIIGIGRSLGMKVVAEGVESERHAIVAASLGCDYLQGYYFGKPMSCTQFNKLLTRTDGMIWPDAVAGDRVSIGSTA